MNKTPNRNNRSIPVIGFIVGFLFLYGLRLMIYVLILFGLKLATELFGVIYEYDIGSGFLIMWHFGILSVVHLLASGFRAAAKKWSTMISVLELFFLAIGLLGVLFEDTIIVLLLLVSNFGIVAIDHFFPSIDLIRSFFDQSRSLREDFLGPKT